MNVDKILSPFKREFWEHRNSFIGVFAALGLLLVVLQVVSIINGTDNGNVSINIVLDDDQLKETIGLNELIDSKLKYLVFILLHVFISISTIVTIYYQLGCLYDDRKDRSILFWKSLPVSETQSVVTKLLTGVYVIPIFALIIGSITSVILSLIVAAWLPSHSDYSFFHILSQLNFVSAFFLALLFIIISGIWLSPFCAWLLFASAATKRSPLMFATLPPILIIISERLLLGQSQFLAMLRAYMPDFEALDSYTIELSGKNIGYLMQTFINGPEIVVGIIVAALLIAASIWCRNNRYEI